MNKGIKRIIHILRHPKHKQIKNGLIKISKGKVIGKCALGEIGCQSSIKPAELFVMSYGAYPLILQKAGIPKSLRTDMLLPQIVRHHNIKTNKKWVEFIIWDNDELNGYTNLQTYIYTMNDAGYTYKQIADFLEITFGKY